MRELKGTPRTIGFSRKTSVHRREFAGLAAAQRATPVRLSKSGT